MWEKSVLMIVSIPIIHPYETMLKVFINENLRQKLNKLTDEGVSTLSAEDSA